MQTGSPPDIAYLGPEGTYTHTVARQVGGSLARLVPCASIPLVFRLVSRSEVGLGVVPVENTIEGSVAVTLDSFAREPECKITGERMLRIEHGLHAHPETAGVDSLRRIYSHPQALAQCRDWLTRTIPTADIIPCASTAAAARWASEESGTAAIGGAELARLYGLKTIASGIQDAPYNVTRFLLLARHSPAASGNDRTALMVELNHRPGALYEGLGYFARAGVNLTHIESRPIPERPFEYRFFLMLDGHAADAAVVQALAELRAEHPRIAILGSWPRGAMPRPDQP